MNGWTSLDRFLRTDPRDVGCAEAIAMLHVYVDLVATGAPVQDRYPRHRRAPARLWPVRGRFRRPAGHRGGYWAVLRTPPGL